MVKDEGLGPRRPVPLGGIVSLTCITLSASKGLIWIFEPAGPETTSSCASVPR